MGSEMASETPDKFLAVFLWGGDCVLPSINVRPLRNHHALNYCGLDKSRSKNFSFLPLGPIVIHLVGLFEGWLYC